MANHLLSENMIEREAIRVATMLGFACNVKCFYEIKDDDIHLSAIFNNKSLQIRFEKHTLKWSLDDLSEKVIIPAFKKLLPRDLAFINNDET